MTDDHDTVEADVFGVSAYLGTSAYLAEDAALQLIDVETIALSHPEHEMFIAVERAVSIHILDMKSTTASQSQRALRLFDDYRVGLAPTHLWSVSGEGQTVVLPAVQWNPRLSLLSVPPALRGVGEALDTVSDALRDFVAPILNKLAVLPEQEWRQAMIAAVAEKRDPPSPWAEAIGPLYSLTGMSSALGIPEEFVLKLAANNAIFGLDSAEGEQLFPVVQVAPDGGVVPGLQWLLGQLHADLVDRYTLAAWLDGPKSALEQRNVWEELRDFDQVSGRLRRLVSEYRSGLAQ